MSGFSKWAMPLVIIGAANAGLAEIAHTDIMATLLGSMSHGFNVLVGVSGLYLALTNYTNLLKKA